jgi:hypothetical protein
MLIDQVAAGDLGVAGEVAGDRVEQAAALVGGIAVVVAVGAVEAALGGGAGDHRSGTQDAAWWRSRSAGVGVLPGADWDVVPGRW